MPLREAAVAGVLGAVRPQVPSSTSLRVFPPAGPPTRVRHWVPMQASGGAAGSIRLDCVAAAAARSKTALHLSGRLVGGKQCMKVSLSHVFLGACQRYIGAGVAPE